MWFNKLMVRFFMSLDVVLFNFIGTLYDLLIAISRTTILTQGDIAYFVTRIEILLGIFMLFKVSFSLITYIVNPDDFSDSGKGFGKLVRNSIVSLVLLVLVPYIFQLAFNLQMKILDDNILAKLLLGERIENEVMYVEEGSTTSETESILNTAGETMAFYVMIPFFSPNYSVEGLEECINMIDSDGNFSSECSEALKTAGMESPDLDNYIYGVENKSLGLTFRQNTGLATTKGTSSTDNNDNNNNDNETATNKKADEQFIISYQKPISTIAAVVVCLLLISFCMDVGVRSIKLSFLQLIYPIPVISYMDPKSGQDGMFYKWYKMCLSTFLSLFIRLLALYFGIYIISKVSDFGMYDIINGSQITNGWVKIFIIIGVLMFVKQLPKILESMGFKIDGEGKFNLNPLKKFAENAALGKQIIGTAGAGAAGAAAFGTNLVAKKGNVFSALAGGASAFGRGMKGAAKGESFGKNFKNSYGAAMRARANRAERKRYGISGAENLFNRAQQSMNIETEGQRLSREIKDMDEFSTATAGLKSETESIVEKKKAGINAGLSMPSIIGETSGREYKFENNLSIAAAERMVQVMENNGDAAAAAKLSDEVMFSKKKISGDLQLVASGEMSVEQFNTNHGASIDDGDMTDAKAYFGDADDIYRHSKVVKKIVKKNSTQGKTIVENYMEGGKAAKTESTTQKGRARRQQILDQQSQKKA